MQITFVKVRLVTRPSSKLVAFACLTFDDCFVVRDIKVIRGDSTLFVAMPSRKITDTCKKCKVKNHVQSRYCSQCGATFRTRRVRVDARGRAKLHADIAHPTNAACRDMIEDAVLHAYAEELERSKQPGYVPPSDDILENGFDDDENGCANGLIDHELECTPAQDAKPDAPTAPDPTAPGNQKPEDQSGDGFGIFTS